ncbi:MAG: zinc transporter ZupT [Candidatus Kapaibacteriales bacterium]
MEENLLLAFGYTAFAGLSTGLGSAIGLFAKHKNTNFLSFAMGFSAGVMIYVSFVEIFLKSRDSLSLAYGETAGMWITVGSFFGGILLIGIIDKFIPKFENPHEFYRTDELEAPEKSIKVPQNKNRLLRIGLMTALAIGIHNFPEGMATFAATLKDPSIGLAIAVAIAIHNIPEGIAVSVPIYYATGNRKKAFWYSFSSGLAEPVGALVGYFVLSNFFNDLTFGVIFGGIAGVMVFISLDQLLPAAEEYGAHHISIYGLVAGMAVMALSLLAFL